MEISKKIFFFFSLILLTDGLLFADLDTVPTPEETRENCLWEFMKVVWDPSSLSQREAALLTMAFSLGGLRLFEGFVESVKDYSIRAPFFYTHLELRSFVLIPATIFSWVYGRRIYARWVQRKIEAERERSRAVFKGVLDQE